MAEILDESPKLQRARLTCSACHKRKIKCDKNIPCGSCIKRGVGNACSRENSTPVRASAIRDIQDHHAPQQSSELIQALLTRVSQLEAAAQVKGEQPTPISSTLDRPSTAAGIGPLTLSSNPELVELEEPPDTDAATVLEFLAWGRRKDQDFHEAPENQSGPRRHSAGQEDAPQVANSLLENIKSAQLDVLEALLPSRVHILQLVEFHSQSLLWYHGSFSSRTFSQDLRSFFADYNGRLRHKDLNIQWIALLYAILTGSLTCASPSKSRSWGFSQAEKISLSSQWYNATVTCLNLSSYHEVHTIYSVQACATLTISAHILGFSNSQSVLLASVSRIAQSLGLHRLSSESPKASIADSRKRETGRRLWAQLCTQDWFSIPFSESYSLNPKFFDTAKPINCNDDDMEPKPQSTPTQSSYCNYLYDIASLMPQLQDAMASSNTLFTKYEQVLQYDDKMRKLATAYMPTFLSTTSPVASDWPLYVGWARRSLAICAAHKIIMIHRKFLGLSFTNAAFSFTRRTCLAASKTILKEARAASDDNGPVLWIDQAFTVAAGIILALDAFHRKPEEKEFGEHKNHVSEAIDYLKRFESSKIATRGVQLLSFLSSELESTVSTNPRKRVRGDGSAEDRRAEKRQRVFNLKSFINNISTDMQVTTPTASEFDNAAEIAWDAFVDLLPPQTGFGEENLFDDFFSFEF